MHRIGIDLGGTKIEGVALDGQGNECSRLRVPTEKDKYESVLNGVVEIYSAMRDAIGDQPHTFGMGTPGSISPRTGLLRNSNTLCLNGRPLRADLERMLGRPAPIHNDANCFAVAEALHGAGRGYDMVFGVIMGTGCGGGLVINGTVRYGRLGIAGEWGHTSIDPNGPSCYCGQRGCVETFISGGGLACRYGERYGRRVEFPEVIASYRAGDKRSSDFINDFLRAFGRCIANLIDVLDPDVIVLGGGVSNFDELYTKGVEEVRQFVFSDYCDTPIVRHQLGDSAGVLGAAMIGI